jgi:hypothetical protein
MESRFDLRTRTAYALRDSEALVRRVHDEVRALQAAAFVSSGLIRDSRQLLAHQGDGDTASHGVAVVAVRAFNMTLPAANRADAVRGCDGATDPKLRPERSSDHRCKPDR